MNCCWKSKWLSLFKKRYTTLVISTQNSSILAKFARKKKLAVFYWLFLGEVYPRNFPWNQLIFPRICPWKSFEIWLFSAKFPQNRPIFLRILIFLPRKSREIGLFFLRISTFFPAKIPGNRPIFCRICPWKSQEILLFFPRKYIRSPVMKNKDNFNSFKNKYWQQVLLVPWASGKPYL